MHKNCLKQSKEKTKNIWIKNYISYKWKNRHISTAKKICVCVSMQGNTESSWFNQEGIDFSLEILLIFLEGRLIKRPWHAKCVELFCEHIKYIYISWLLIKHSTFQNPLKYINQEDALSQRNEKYDCYHIKHVHFFKNFIVTETWLLSFLNGNICKICKIYI